MKTDDIEEEPTEEDRDEANADYRNQLKWDKQVEELHQQHLDGDCRFGCTHCTEESNLKVDCEN